MCVCVCVFVCERVCVRLNPNTGVLVSPGHPHKVIYPVVFILQKNISVHHAGCSVRARGFCVSVCVCECVRECVGAHVKLGNI